MVALAAGALVVAAFAPAVAPGSVFAAAARQVLRPLCHQDPSRSFAIGEVALSVCHRCTGIDVGIFAGALAAVLGLRVPAGSRLAWGLAALPIAIHVAARYVLPSTDLVALRVATGFVFGAFCGAALASAVSSVASHSGSETRGASVGSRKERS